MSSEQRLGHTKGLPKDHSAEYFIDFGLHFIEAAVIDSDDPGVAFEYSSRMLADDKRSGVKILGIPFDNAVSFRKGARLAPERVRYISNSLESYSPVLDKDLTDLKYYDLGDLNGALLAKLRPSEAADVIFEKIKHLAESNLVIIGGDHSVSVPVINAYHHLYPELHVIHIDSHLDYRNEYEKEPHSHACPMRRARDLLGAGRLVQLGYRSCPKEEKAAAEADGLFVSPELILPDEVRDKLTGKPIYLSIDIDILDPSCAPGVGVPEPGGPGFKELMDLLYSLSDLDIKAFDVVEVTPPFDPSDITSAAAAKIVRECMLAYFCD